MFKKIVTIALSTISICGFAAQNTKTLAETPPMGWNSWYHFWGKIDDATIRAQADAMVASGMRDAGYVYINIDDTWEGKRDEKGVIHPNAKFPDMKALADYVHSKGLKFGIYSSPGPTTCAGYEGSYQHEEQDAKTYAEWGVDFVKYDLCSFQNIMANAGSPQAANQLMIDAYKTMANAIAKTGRPMMFSLCQYGLDDVWKWGPSVGGNLWRTTGDLSDNYNRVSEIGFSQTGLSQYASPGHWNDPDMLQVGNGGMNTEEYRTQVSLWAILAAPFLAGNDLTNMSQETKELLMNREVIAVDQDKAGMQGDRVRVDGLAEIWARPLADGSKAVGLFNRSIAPMDIQINFSDIGFKGSVNVRDLWLHRDLGSMEKYHVRVPAHGVVMLRVIGQK